MFCIGRLRRITDLIMTIDMGAPSFHAAKAANNTISTKPSAYDVQKVVVCISIPICIFGLLGNGIVFAFLCCFIKKTKYTIYALNIALADLVNLFYQFVFFFIFLKPIYTTELLTRILSMVNISTDNAAFFILTTFCMERCLLMYLPDWSQQHLSKIRPALICIVLWGFACLIAIVEFIACQQNHENSLSCWATIIVKMIIELLFFFTTLFLSTLGIFIRTQTKELETPLVTVDITIIIMSVHFLIFDGAVRILDAIVFWSERTDLPLTSVSILCDIICSSGNLLIYLFVGCCRPPKFWRPFQASLKRALEENVPETREETQEQAC